MENHEEIIIQIPFLKLSAKCWGDPKGIPLLGLHGWLDNAATFDHLAPFLKEFRLVSLDLPGHGLSEHRPPGTSYHFIDMIVNIIEVVNYLGWERFSLIGHSMGAAVASYLAGTIPEKIDLVILIEGLGSITKKNEKMPDILLQSSNEWMSLKEKKLPIYPNIETAVKVRKSAGKILESSVRTLVSRGLKRVEGGFTWNSDPRLKIKSRHYFSEEQSIVFLEKIIAPVLLIDGKKTKKDLWKELYRGRMSYVKNLEHKIVYGDHHLHLDNPESVAEVLKEFFKKNNF